LAHRLSLGERDETVASGARVTYVRHVAGGGAPSTALFVLSKLVPLERSARLRQYDYTLPIKSTVCEKYGVVAASTFVTAANRAGTNGAPACDSAPFTGELVLPHDAHQVLAFIANDLAAQPGERRQAPCT
jgi:hypothetical protein